VIYLGSGVYKFYFNNINSLNLIFFSIKYGWSVYPIISKNKSSSAFLVFFFGMLRLYFLLFKIKGFGFKFIKIRKGVLVKLGYTHRLVVLIGKNQKIAFKSKFKIIYFARDLNVLKLNFAFFTFFLFLCAFKKTGVFLKGTLYVLKL